MPPNTFEAEIFSFPHTYTKLTFGTAGIKKLDKVISTYKIPDGEQIVAYMKGTITLFGLTTEGTIITDCALYIKKVGMKKETDRYEKLLKEKT